MSRRLVRSLLGRITPGGGFTLEQPLWRALVVLRLITLVYAVCRFAVSTDDYDHPLGGWIYLGVLTAWSLATLPRIGSAARCTRPFLAADLAIATGGILLTAVLADPDAVAAGEPTLPTIWTASSVLAFAIRSGWRWGAAASVLVGVCNVLERGDLTQGNVHNIVLLFVSSSAVGYVVELGRASERALTRALRIEAATRERERLARDIHDSVLQVLAMVQRRGTEIGGEAAELGRMAGEQEAALRALITGVPRQVSAAARELAPAGAASGGLPASPPPAGAVGERDDEGPRDLRAMLAPFAGTRVTLSAPGTPVLLEAHAAQEVAAAVSAALDNVRRHAGEGAHAWILVEEEPDEVLVTVRDDGPGYPPRRLAEAEREGRLGVAQSIRGRLRDLGGAAEVVSVVGQGVEVEMRLPRRTGRTRRRVRR